MKDDQKGRRPKWKTTKMEDDQHEDDQNRRRPNWKTTKMDDDQNEIMSRLQKLFLVKKECGH